MEYDGQKDCMRDGKIPEEWRTGLIVPKWIRKVDVHDPGKYRGITLLSHVDVAGKNQGGRIIAVVEGKIGEEQQECRQGRVTTDVVLA